MLSYTPKSAGRYFQAPPFSIFKQREYRIYENI
jgi:hypothetical protein